jgi:hypothetical protein
MKSTNEPDLGAALAAIETRIHHNEGDSIRARWECGSLLRSHKRGKQLPKGLRVLLRDTLKIAPSEITSRMKLADRYSTADKLATAVARFPTWTALRKSLVTPKGKASPPKASGIQRVLTLLEELDPATLTEVQVTAMEQQLQRLRAKVVFLRKAA